MSVRRARLAFVLAFLLAPVAVAAPPAAPLANQVPNGDFNTDVSGWDGNSSTFTITHSAGPALDVFGSATSGSLRAGITIPSIAYANGGGSRCIDGVAGGQDYTLGAWIRVPSGQSCGMDPCSAGVFAQFWSGAGCTVGVLGGSGAGNVASDGSNGALDTWVLRTANVTAPAGTASVLFYLVVTKGSDAGATFNANFDGARFGPLGTLPVSLQEFSAE